MVIFISSGGGIALSEGHKMESSIQISKMFSESVLAYQKADTAAAEIRHFGIVCEAYKALLDSNFFSQICIDGHYKTIYMIEVKFDGCEWGATPNIFASQEEAEKQVQALKRKYPFLSECRVTTREIRRERE